MDNYDAFKSFLDEKEVHYDEGSLERGDRYLRIPQRMKSGGTADILVIFSEKNIKVLIINIASVPDDKQDACYKLFNELNAQYSFFKFYIRSNGDINVEGDAILGIVEGEFRPKALMAFVLAAFTLVQDNYRDIMKILWF